MYFLASPNLVELIRIRQTPLLDEFDETPGPPTLHAVDIAERIGFHNASFTWKAAKDRPFTLRIEGSLYFSPGINLIIG
jgi:hypothetical protein